MKLWERLGLQCVCFRDTIQPITEGMWCYLSPESGLSTEAEYPILGDSHCLGGLHFQVGTQRSLGNVVPGIQSRAMMGSRPAGIGNKEVHPTQILVLISFRANADQHFYASCSAFSLLEKGRRPNIAQNLHTPVEIVVKFCSEKCDWFFLNHLFTYSSRHIVFLFLAVIT